MFTFKIRIFIIKFIDIYYRKSTIYDNNVMNVCVIQNKYV